MIANLDRDQRKDECQSTIIFIKQSKGIEKFPYINQPILNVVHIDPVIDKISGDGPTMAQFYLLTNITGFKSIEIVRVARGIAIECGLRWTENITRRVHNVVLFYENKTLCT